MSFLTVYFFSKSLIWDESFCRFVCGEGGGAGRGFWEESDDLQGKWIGGGGVYHRQQSIKAGLKIPRKWKKKQMNKNKETCFRYYQLLTCFSVKNREKIPLRIRIHDVFTYHLK